MNPSLETPLTRHAGIEVPLLCGAMYPCSNPELVAAVSDAGGMGIVQPVSLTYVHGHDFREGLRLIRRLTPKPIGMNALIEASSRRYRERMERWVDVALEEGVRFFVTSLGNPRWVAERAHAAGSCGRAQGPHQLGAEAPAVPVVGYHDGALRAIGILHARIATYPDDLFLVRATCLLFFFPAYFEN